MAFRFTNAEFEALTASDAANVDIVGILRDIQGNPESWEILEAMMTLSQLRAVHRIAEALLGIEMNSRPKRQST